MLIVGTFAGGSAQAAPVDNGAALNALAQARLAEDAGDPAAALSALTRVASEAPDLPGLRGRMLEQAIDAGDLAAARGAALKLWQAGERRFDAQLVLAVDAMRRSDWRAARDTIGGQGDKTGGDAIAKLIQPAFNSWIDVGARGKTPEQPLLDAAGKGRPEPVLAFEAALVQLAAKRPADAAALAGRTAPTDRTSQLVALRLAATLEAAGEVEAARALRERIAMAAGGREDPMLLLPDQPVTTSRGGMAQWLAMLGDGFARMPNGSPKLSMLFARAAWWLDDRDWTVRSALVEALDRSDRGAEAAALLAGGRTALPPVLEMRRAELMADAGDLAGAAALAEKAARATPSARSMLVRFADIARRADDRDAAERAYAAIEATLGDEAEDRALHGTLLIARAELRLQADDWDGASALIERALALRPADPTILNFAGYSALERRKNVGQSLKQIETAWNAEPQNAAITDSLGWAYFLTGRTAEAVPLLEQAQASEPGNAVIVEHLGDAYWKAGRKFQARYTWRAAALLAEDDMAVRLDAKLRDGLTSATTAP
ncbi:tetratricopeptide repeat protein [Sphingopyxis sp.]|uniref:tetratricopeptide repeat protein n=1 Tax=Sphingopyxis sp. TaxID=1908224 RepID=UPI0035B42963